MGQGSRRPLLLGEPGFSHQLRNWKSRAPGRTAESEQIIGKTDYDLSPAFLADQFRLDDEHVLTGKRIVNRIEMVGQPDGQTVWNITNKIPLFDRHGSIIGTAGITRRLNTLDARTASTAPNSVPYWRTCGTTIHAPMTNEQLARLAHMSVRAFERKFRGSFHLTPQKYLRKLQMRMASRALVYTSQPLAEVAVGCGFADQSHFTPRISPPLRPHAPGISRTFRPG